MSSSTTTRIDIVSKNESGNMERPLAEIIDLEEFEDVEEVAGFGTASRRSKRRPIYKEEDSDCERDEKKAILMKKKQESKKRRELHKNSPNKKKAVASGPVRDDAKCDRGEPLESTEAEKIGIKDFSLKSLDSEEGGFLTPCGLLNTKGRAAGWLHQMCHQCQRSDVAQGAVTCFRGHKCHVCPADVQNKDLNDAEPQLKKKCRALTFCRACIKNWYSPLTDEDVRDSCPYCRGICNCKECLRTDDSEPDYTAEDLPVSTKRNHYLMILFYVLPFLELLGKEEAEERATEARVVGKDAVKTVKKKLESGFRSTCDCCSTSILNIHRFCSHPEHEFELCLKCVSEIRSDKGLWNDKKWEISDGKIICPEDGHPLLLGSFFGDEFIPKLIREIQEVKGKLKKQEEDLQKNIDRSKFEKCKLCLSSEKEVKKGKKDLNNANLSKEMADLENKHNIRHAANRDENGEDKTHNFLWCPSAADMPIKDRDAYLDHFMDHWRDGVPVIVRDAWSQAKGISWLPKVMCRAVRERGVKGKKGKKLVEEVKEVLAIDCYEWGETCLDVYGLFSALENHQVYSEGFPGQPQILKVKDFPAKTDFQDKLAAHGKEFRRSCPFHEYTHPISGILNLATKLPETALKPDLGPKGYIGNGFWMEMGRGDSVTKCHLDMADAINIKFFSKEMNLTEDEMLKLIVAKKSHDEEMKAVAEKMEANENVEQMVQAMPMGAAEQKLEEIKPVAGAEDTGNTLVCDASQKSDEAVAAEPAAVLAESQGTEPEEYEIPGKNGKKRGRRADSISPKKKKLAMEDMAKWIAEEKAEKRGGSLWDIFRREDLPALKAYMLKHKHEFWHNGGPVTEVVDPIHDQSFYLTRDHLKALKAETGIEPWTFFQDDGEAVFVPAGCPHQVRNVKSCIKVAVDFISPENVGQCVQLTQEFRTLPEGHPAKEDKLQIASSYVFAAQDAVKQLKQILSSKK